MGMVKATDKRVGSREPKAWNYRRTKNKTSNKTERNATEQSSNNRKNNRKTIMRTKKHARETSAETNVALLVARRGKAKKIIHMEKKVFSFSWCCYSKYYLKKCFPNFSVPIRGSVLIRCAAIMIIYTCNGVIVALVLNLPHQSSHSVIGSPTVSISLFFNRGALSFGAL